MTVQMILLPLFVHVALMLAILLRGVARAEPVEGREEALAALLFYTLTVLALFTRKADVLFIVLAWAFVVLRAVAVFPQVLSARMPGRSGIVLASLAVLALMWVVFALAILLNI